jgi:hypothetical protein
MNPLSPVLAEVMNGPYERSRAATKGSYERRYERDFLLRVAMPVSHCSPDSGACRRSNVLHLRASPGPAGRCRAAE